MNYQEFEDGVLGVSPSSPESYYAEKAWNHQQAVIDSLLAQLVERDALMVKANYVIDHARTIDKQAYALGAQNVDHALFRGLGNLLAQYDAALPASAEPSAPQVTLVSYAEDMSTCTLTKGDGIGYFYDRMNPSAPVELDERAEFDKFTVSKGRVIGYCGWREDFAIWQARAALERKS